MMSKNQQIEKRRVIRVEEDGLIDFQFAVLDRMKALDISRADLARGLGVTPARISQILSSESNPTIKIVARVADILQLELLYSPKKEALSGRVDDRLDDVSETAMHALAHSMARAEAHWGVDNDFASNDNDAGLRAMAVA